MTKVAKQKQMVCDYMDVIVIGTNSTGIKDAYTKIEADIEYQTLLEKKFGMPWLTIRDYMIDLHIDGMTDEEVLANCLTF